MEIFFCHLINRSFDKALILFNESSTAGKTLIKVGPNEMAEIDHLGVQIEHLNKAKSGLEGEKHVVRDCPSLVGGRPAKSVVERPRGFKSHIPRHFQIQPIYELIFGNYAQIIV
jgi:hypothetical protein